MISVIIRNRNEAEHIGFAIQSVIDHIGSDKADIKIIDNKSTDDSMEVVNLFRDRIDIQVAEIPSYTPGSSLNLGVGLSDNPFILIMSAHFQITEFSYGHLESFLLGEWEGYDAVFGKQIPIYRGKKITPRYIWEHFGDLSVDNMESHIENRPFLHNAFCFYKKEVLEEHPFDIDVPGKEDRFWARDCINRGGKYLYTPTFKGNHFWTSKGATWQGLG